MSEINFVGDGFQAQIPNSSSVVINVQIDFMKLMDIPRDQYGKIHLTVCQRRSPVHKTDATHYVKEDKFKSRG